VSQESVRIYSSSEVAGRLGVSTSLLRRYGLAWERVQGESLPQLPGLGRLYPEDVLETLLEAHAWTELRPEAGVEEALRAVLGVSTAGGRDAELAHAVQESVSRALSPLLAELHGLRSELRALQARLGAPQEEAQEGAQGVAELEEVVPAEEAAATEEVDAVEVDAVEAEPAPLRRSATRTPPADPDWDFSLREPPVPAPKIRLEERKGYPPEPWPTPWRVQPREDESAADFEALEDDFASERERDDEQDKGFVNWFKRNF
jgi:DNA-binding transcriptional MerR regulator